MARGSVISGDDRAPCGLWSVFVAWLPHYVTASMSRGSAQLELQHFCYRHHYTPCTLPNDTNLYSSDTSLFPNSRLAPDFADSADLSTL